MDHGSHNHLLAERELVRVVEETLRLARHRLLLLLLLALLQGLDLVTQELLQWLTHLLMLSWHRLLGSHFGRVRVGLEVDAGWCALALCADQSRHRRFHHWLNDAACALVAHVHLLVHGLLLHLLRLLVLCLLGAGNALKLVIHVVLVVHQRVLRGVLHLRVEALKGRTK